MASSRTSMPALPHSDLYAARDMTSFAPTELFHSSSGSSDTTICTLFSFSSGMSSASRQDMMPNSPSCLPSSAASFQFAHEIDIESAAQLEHLPRTRDV